MRLPLIVPILEDAVCRFLEARRDYAYTPMEIAVEHFQNPNLAVIIQVLLESLRARNLVQARLFRLDSGTSVRQEVYYAIP
jgi:hypothetical protein